MTRWIATAAALALAAPAAAQDEPETPPNAPPAWLVEHVQTMTRDGGLWVADNSERPEEGWDAYGLEWTAGPGDFAMTGRLFGYRDGAESDGDFWQFQVYWDPQAREAAIVQSGWSALGAGVMWMEGGEVVTRQTFHDFAGETTVRGHRASHPDPDTHVTVAFEIVDGAWREVRRDVWERQPPDGA